MTWEFRAERRGRQLLSRSHLYVGAHIRCVGDEASPWHVREYENSCFSVVVSGTLHYTTEAGAGLAHRGAILTGNRAETFSYRFPTTEPVVRSLVAISPGMADEIAADLDLARSAFMTPLIPPSGQTLQLYAAIRRLAAQEIPSEELALSTVAELMTIGRKLPKMDASRVERRRIRDVARYLSSAYAEPITLDQMAERANLSRYHFIRVFQQVIGESPRKHLISARLRAAADRLIETREPVIAIALNSGFNDISHFTNSFRRAFGLSPRQLRASA